MTGILLEQLQLQRNYYNTGSTRSYAFRKEQLKKLKAAILKFEKELHQALYEDLKKSPEESWITETGFVISEINAAIKGLAHWMQPEKTKTNLLNFPSTSFILREPLGVVLIIAPWNYPLQLLFTPLVGAMAAGNCIMLKAGEFAVATSSVIEKIIKDSFNAEYITTVSGDGAEVVPAMMRNFRFDHVFFTGSTVVGKQIYRMAAEQLTPVTLELGGKSPCIVEADANIKVAARRIALTGFSNAGQMCATPDYILIHDSVKEKFLQELKEATVKFYLKDASQSYNYGKIINEKQFNRLVNYLDHGKIIHGGKYDKSKLFIEPTIIVDVPLDSPLMKEEIFGPILPVISFQNFQEAKAIVELNANPLAFYVFTSSRKKEKQWLTEVSFGGGCINNASWQLTNYHLPFGGIGNSGIGNYHGKYSFETFTHRKAIMKTPTWFDPDIKYPPFKGKLGLFKKVIR